MTFIGPRVIFLEVLTSPARQNRCKQENNGSGVIARCQIVRFRALLGDDVSAETTG
jgi:hypothetical protein